MSSTIHHESDARTTPTIYHTTVPFTKRVHRGLPSTLAIFLYFQSISGLPARIHHHLKTNVPFMSCHGYAGAVGRHRHTTQLTVNNEKTRRESFSCTYMHAINHDHSHQRDDTVRRQSTISILGLYVKREFSSSLSLFYFSI